jgi:hypothetical protein
MNIAYLYHLSFKNDWSTSEKASPSLDSASNLQRILRAIITVEGQDAEGGTGTGTGIVA